MTAGTDERSTSAEFAQYIGGSWVAPAADEVVDIVNPATGLVYAQVPRASVADAEAAIRAARLAFDEGPWPRLPGAERARILHGFADELDRHRKQECRGDDEQRPQR